MVKSVALVAVMPPTVTVILPVVAPTRTEATSWVVLPEVNVAVVPLNLTVLEPRVALKLVPTMVTGVPTMPLDGDTLEIVGSVGGVTTVAKVKEI